MLTQKYLQSKKVLIGHDWVCIKRLDKLDIFDLQIQQVCLCSGTVDELEKEFDTHTVSQITSAISGLLWLI